MNDCKPFLDGVCRHVWDLSSTSRTLRSIKPLLHFGGEEHSCDDQVVKEEDGNSFVVFLRRSLVVFETTMENTQLRWRIEYR